MLIPDGSYLIYIIRAGSALRSGKFMPEKKLLHKLLSG